MTFRYGDRIQETLTVTGTGAISLGTPATGFLGFASIPGIANGDLVPYVINDTTANTWETGVATYATGAPNTLTRTVVTANSSGGTTAFSFAGNSCQVFCAPSAALMGGLPFSPPLKTGQYYPPAGSWNTSGAQVGTMLYYPVYIPNPIVLASMSVKFGATVNTGTFRFAINKDANGQPGTKLYDSGGTAVSATNNNTTLTISSIALQLTPGIYWVGVGSTASFNCYTQVAAAGSGAYGFSPLPVLLGASSVANAFGLTYMCWSCTDLTSSTLPSTPTGLALSTATPAAVVLGF